MSVQLVYYLQSHRSIDAHALAAVCVADDQPVSLDATLWPLLYALRAVMPVIKRGLGKRVTLVTTKLFPDREVKSRVFGLICIGMMRPFIVASV